MYEAGSIDTLVKIVDKSGNSKEMSHVLFEAATRRNPTVESLEHFYIKYSYMLKSYKYSIGGESITFEDIIKHIRMDDDQGRTFIDKLLQKAILLETEI